VVLMPIGLKKQNCELQEYYWFAFFSSKILQLTKDING